MAIERRKVSQVVLHRFLNLSGYCFEQSIPLRGIPYNHPYTAMGWQDWLEGVGYGR